MTEHAQPMSEQEAQDRLHTLGGGWQLNAAGHLEQRFGFSDFMGAMRFANAVAEAAEAANHHPDLTITWGMCRRNLDSRHRRTGGETSPSPPRLGRSTRRSRRCSRSCGSEPASALACPRLSTPMPHYRGSDAERQPWSAPAVAWSALRSRTSASAASARFSSDTGGSDPAASSIQQNVILGLLSHPDPSSTATQTQDRTFATDRLEPRQLLRVEMSSADQLAEMFIFKGVDRSALLELCTMAPPVSFKTGVTIFTQG